MKKKVFMFVCAMMMAMTACGGNGNGGADASDPFKGGPGPAGEPKYVTTSVTTDVEKMDVEAKEPSDEQASKLGSAGLNILAATMATEENTLISPFSIQMALGMTENGASGDTLTETENVINGGVYVEDINPIMLGMSERFVSAEDVDWNVANSIWFRDDGKWAINDDFAKEVVSFYNADFFMAPFDNTTVYDINNWVNDETRGMIPEVIDSISKEDRMFLINAIAFEGKWEQTYSDDDIYEDRTFNNEDGSDTNVTLLYSEENKYFNLEGGDGFLKPYEGGEYSFMAILPPADMTNEEYINLLVSEGADITSAINGAENKEVHAMIPEFSVDFGYLMNDTLKGLGMETPFDQNKADFYDMVTPVNVDGGNAWIGGIIHMTHLELDREGTKAAAVTAVELCTCDAVMIDDSVSIVLDRPFIYGIVDNSTGLPVFIGSMENME